MPRAKRSKQYRKLMEQFSIGFGFHVPYQVLVDADFLAEAEQAGLDIAPLSGDEVRAVVDRVYSNSSDDVIARLRTMLSP